MFVKWGIVCLTESSGYICIEPITAVPPVRELRASTAERVLNVTGNWSLLSRPEGAVSVYILETKQRKRGRGRRVGGDGE